MFRKVALLVVLIVVILSAGLASAQGTYYFCPLGDQKYSGALGQPFTTTSTVVVGTEHYFDQHCVVELVDGSLVEMPASEVSALLQDYDGLSKAEIAESADQLATLGFIYRSSAWAWDLTQMSAGAYKSVEVQLDIQKAVPMWVQMGRVGNEESWPFRFFAPGDDGKTYMIQPDGSLVQVSFTCPELDFSTAYYGDYLLTGAADYSFADDRFFCETQFNQKAAFEMQPLDFLLYIAEFDDFFPIGDFPVRWSVQSEKVARNMREGYFLSRPVVARIEGLEMTLEAPFSSQYYPLEQPYRGIYNLQYGITILYYEGEIFGAIMLETSLLDLSPAVVIIELEDKTQ